MRVRILGECVIELTDREYTPTATHFFALLLRLAADSGRFFQRQELAHLLFPNATNERAATHSLRQLIYQAIQRGVPLDKSRSGIGLRQASLSLDIDDTLRDDLSLATCRVRALTVLPGYSPSFSDSFNDWLETFRAHQQARVRQNLVTSLEPLRQRANWPALEARSIECLSLDPLSESATLSLAEALARMGSKERAVSLLNDYNREVGTRNSQLAIPASLLRRRIEGDSATSPLVNLKSPLVGRGDAMASMHENWQLVRGGQPRFTVIRGEPGSGKSRLLDEFGETLRLAGNSNILIVRKSSPERFRPFAFFAELVPHLLRLSGSAGCDPRLLHFLTRLSGGLNPDDCDTSTAGGSHYISTGINSAIVDALDAVCGEKPVVLLIDDSRAIDDVSLSLIEDLRAIAPTLRLYLVMICDEADRRDRVARLNANTITLTPLPAESARQLLLSLLDATSCALPQETISWCATIAAGNPAFLHLLAARGGALLHKHDIPNDVVSAVDRRLNSLSPTAARVLESCAVLGDHCDSMILEEVVGLPTFSIIAALDELERASLIDCSGSLFMLRSTLFRDRILLLARKSVLTILHARSAKAMETLDKEADSSWRIANHWRNAGQVTRARTTLAASWRRSLQLGHPNHAEESIREYLALISDVPERIALYDDLIVVTQASGNAGATIDAIDERSALVGSFNGTDVRREMLAFDRLDAQLQNHADPTQPERDLLAYMQSPSLDSARRHRAAQRLIASADATADSRLALDVYDAIHDFPASNPDAYAYYNQALLIFHTVFGDKMEAASLALAILTRATRDSYDWPNIRGKVNASLALRVVGTSNDAIAHLETCYSELRAAGALPFCILVASRLASFYLDDGNITEAIQWLQRAASHTGARNIGRLPSEYLSAHADLSIVTGQLHSAADAIRTMRDVSPLHQAPRFRMELLSYTLRLAQYEGRDAEESDVDELLAWHYRARSYGRHDDGMDSLWVALTRQGRHSVASQLLEDYLRFHRRETRPCGYFLRMRTRSDRAWQALKSTAQ